LVNGGERGVGDTDEGNDERKDVHGLKIICLGK